MIWQTNHSFSYHLSLVCRLWGIMSLIQWSPFCFWGKIVLCDHYLSWRIWEEPLHRCFASCGARCKVKNQRVTDLVTALGLPKAQSGAAQRYTEKLSCFIGKWRIHWYLFLHKNERSKHWRTSHIQTEFRETQHDSFGGKMEQMEEYTVKHKLRRSLPKHFFSDTHWRPAFCMFDKIQGFSWTGVLICFYTFST